MNVGVVKEIKADEHRVALTPEGVRRLAQRGHDVLVERGCGAGAGFADDGYAVAGARLASASEVWSQADLVVKVKEPLPAEFGHLRAGLTLFTYLHLAAEPQLTAALVDSGATAIAYETVATPDGRLPLLEPMSEIAGRLAAQSAAHLLERAPGGPGLLLSGVAGTPAAHVVVIGAGRVGLNAARVALGMGAAVTVLDISVDALRAAEDALDRRAQVRMALPDAVGDAVATADVVVGAVLVPGARAPHVVTRDMLAAMRKGALVVDVAIDQGGCVETARPTTHSDPTYVVDGIVHACIANLPGAVPRTSTLALTNVSMPYVLDLADAGVQGAIARRPELEAGVNVAAGAVTCAPVAALHDLPFAAPRDVLAVAA